MSQFVNLTLWGLIAVVVSLSSARSENLPVLDVLKRLEWTALGVVIAEGTKGGSSCSGTLVAPDLVITAAHCTTKKDGLLDSLRFLAGQTGTRSVAESGSVEILRHPGWANASGATKYQFDIAVVRLSRIIPRDKVRPILLAPEIKRLPHIGALLGYQNAADASLHGRFDCRLYPISKPRLIASECRVIAGNSGGAVLVETLQGWQLTGVIVARKEPRGTALAVEVNGWLRDHVNAALKREALRFASATE